MGERESERESPSRSVRCDHCRLTGHRQIKRPSLSYSTGAPLFYQAPPQLHEATKPNLAKTLAELKLDEIVITDPNLPFTVTVEVKLA